MLVVCLRLRVVVLIVLNTDDVVFVVCFSVSIVDGFMLLCCIGFLVCWVFGFRARVWVCGSMIVVFADLWLFVSGVVCGHCCVFCDAVWYCGGLLFVYCWFVLFVGRSCDFVCFAVGLGGDFVVLCDFAYFVG